MKQRIAITVLLCMLAAAPAWSKNNETGMNFRGTLIEPPPCTVNQGGMVDVDFGDRIGVNKVDGVNYRQQVNYRLQCEPGAANWVLRLSLKGAGSAFDSAALKTNMPDLGIRFYRSGTLLPVGSVIAIDAAAPPLLEAVPVGKAGVKLSQGAFEATATLQADYQ
ncbi:fimbrial protein [Serratia nevei]|uniref:fimbrial protein n=1 Tax=Serratia nevei TaxID=2703794 RepID=UPI00209F5D6A|nr:fimbrial protein [Serratia nevei]MCP1107088.1 fimbrial protein [Serratia nevei]